MTKTADKNLIVGLDIGTSKVAVLVAEVLPDGELNIIGVSNHAAKGMDRGGVNDLDAVVKSISRAIEEAELMANCRIESVFLGITGSHIACRNESGMIPIEDGEVTQSDVDGVIHTAKSVRLNDEQRLLHVLQQEFAIDQQDGIKNPIGFSGVRMVANVHLITCHSAMARNIENCVERLGIRIEQLVFSGLASSYAVLTEDEKKLGVCMIDIGSGTMDIVVYTDDALRHSKVIPYAGNTVTSDISLGFGTPHPDAEAIKLRYGSAVPSRFDSQESIEVPSVGGRPARMLRRQNLAEAIEARYSELFSMVNDELIKVQQELKQRGIKHQLAAGIVLTGGAAQTDGIIECAEQVFKCPVRIAAPGQVRGLSDYVQSPAYSSVVGLVQYGVKNPDQGANRSEAPKSASNFRQLVTKVTNWLSGEF